MDANAAVIEIGNALTNALSSAGAAFARKDYAVANRDFVRAGKMLPEFVATAATLQRQRVSTDLAALSRERKAAGDLAAADAVDAAAKRFNAMSLELAQVAPTMGQGTVASRMAEVADVVDANAVAITRAAQTLVRTTAGHSGLGSWLSTAVDNVGKFLTGGVKSAVDMYGAVTGQSKTPEGAALIQNAKDQAVPIRNVLIGTTAAGAIGAAAALAAPAIAAAVASSSTAAAPTGTAAAAAGGGGLTLEKIATQAATAAKAVADAKAKADAAAAAASQSALSPYTMQQAALLPGGGALPAWLVPVLGAGGLAIVAAAVLASPKPAGRREAAPGGKTGPDSDQGPQAALGDDGEDFETGWILPAALVLGAGGLIWYLTKSGGLSMAFDAAKSGAFKLILPAEARPYGDIILQVSKEKGISPLILAAVGQRESRWGAALTPPGPGGTGDAGHGRGLMQIDDRSFASWIATHNWKDALTNVRMGADVLNSKIAFFKSRSAVSGLADGRGGVTVSAKAAAARGIGAGSFPDPRPLSGSDLLEAAIAAYNTGEGNVLMSLAAGLPPDVTTAGGDYSGDVLARAAELEADLGLA